MVPFGVSSMMRLATVCMNSWSWLEKRMLPLNATKLLLKAWMLSRSRWFVGVSRIRQFAFFSCILAIMHRIFSPPESTFTFFITSSPEKSMRPRNPFITTSLPGPYCESQSTRFLSLLKNSVLSSGR